MAALTVLPDARAARAVLCLIDDAQWLNQVSIEVLGFVAGAFTQTGWAWCSPPVRGRDGRCAAGLPELTVGGLGDEASAGAAGDVAGAKVDRQVTGASWRHGGNPLALVELAAEMTAGLSGWEPLDWPLRFGAVLTSFTVPGAAPPAARRRCCYCGRRPDGEPALIWNAARNLGIDLRGQAAGVSALVS